ncbi:amidohydrolase family protein [Saccharopolyspora phatthalungensis]|uniref:Imidazolonepropionase-like amidohydrolase n=1 Tax=Saccharopolyspora phatthalungensis TaxID=664693 RepID=A0A840QIZ6_9PSEU|nr:amidohydrolase family protein [Saccharopolyspora phatthalungensis]MBB5157483.1 imidazolonepropionase-like amidohydrolase [Saccharopolyspora phatthalungensis]
MTDTLLTADRVLPGPAGQAIVDGGVLVRDGAIAAVGPTDELLQHADAEVRRFPSGTILPGLVDGHVHLVLDAGADQQDIIRRFRERDDELLLEDMHTRAAAAQRAGITTLRDVGDSRGLVARLRDADATTRRLPRLLTAGAPLTIPGGDASFFGGAVDRGDLRSAVTERAEAGVDFISLMASGGHLSPDDAPAPYESQFSHEEIETIVAAAHDVGLPVTAHAHGTQAIVDSVSAGVDVIEHATFTTGPHEVNYDEKCVREMAERGIAVCITASLNWRRIVAQMGADRAHALFYGKLSWLYEAGVPQVPGSRAGTANSQSNDLVSALEAYEWAGVPREIVLDYATAGAARALGLAATTGTLAPDLAADILVVEGDPREDLGALRRVQAVMQDGQWR